MFVRRPVKVKKIGRKKNGHEIAELRGERLPHPRRAGERRPEQEAAEDREDPDPARRVGGRQQDRQHERQAPQRQPAIRAHRPLQPRQQQRPQQEQHGRGEEHRRGDHAGGIHDLEPPHGDRRHGRQQRPPHRVVAGGRRDHGGPQRRVLQAHLDQDPSENRDGRDRKGRAEKECEGPLIDPANGTERLQSRRHRRCQDQPQAERRDDARQRHRRRHAALPADVRIVELDADEKQQEHEPHLAESGERRLEAGRLPSAEHGREQPGKPGAEDRRPEQQARDDLPHDTRLPQPTGHRRTRTGGDDDHDQLHQQRSEALLPAGGQQDRQRRRVVHAHRLLRWWNALVSA
jgi:hypothetical protein